MVLEGVEDLNEINSGNYSLQLLDNQGNILYNLAFNIDFLLFTEPTGIKEVEFAPFTFSIPYYKETSKVLIKRDEDTIIETNPNSKLLHDAVDSIPSSVFIKNPEEYRNALHNKIESVEKMIEQGNLGGALSKLILDIKDKLGKWLIDNYEIESPLQISKEGVIIILDEVIQRLSLMKGEKSAPLLAAPEKTELLQNYPNPSNPETWIPFKLSKKSEVTIKIYNVSGHLVRNIELGNVPAGYYIGKDKAVYWDGKNEAGEDISSGIYFYSIEANGFKAMKKMIIQK